MLNYFSLFLLFFVFISIFYGIIAIHDIPYEISKKRNHPQQDAIHIAGWVSLFTLHIIWPFLWIWATLYREDRGWGFQPTNENSDVTSHDLLKEQISELQNRVNTLEQATPQENFKGDV